MNCSAVDCHCHSRLSHTLILGRQIGVIPSGDFEMMELLWRSLKSKFDSFFVFSLCRAFITTSFYHRPYNLQLHFFQSPQILPALCVLIYHIDINVSLINTFYRWFVVSARQSSTYFCTFRY